MPDATRWAEIDRLFLVDFRLQAELLAITERPDWRELSPRAADPGTVQAQLPSGAVLRVCSVCVEEHPRHQYFCPAVAGYSRPRILREMVRVEDLERAFDATAPKRAGEKSAGMLRSEFWGWGWWLGFEVLEESIGREAWRAARDDIRIQVEEMRARMRLKSQEDVAA